jgi:predicted permease
VNPFRWAFLRARALFARHTIERDMQEELRAHLEQAEERLVARGMSRHEARLAARREFGNVPLIEEEARDARGARWIDSVRGDVLFALRYFARHKATVTIIIVVLALGTGANAMIFSMFQAEFIRPAPAVPGNSRHVRIWSTERPTTTAKWERRGFTGSEVDALSAHKEIYADVAGWTEDEIILDGGDSTGARSGGAQFVTPNFFSALGVPLSAGQGFSQSTSDAPDMTAVMAYAIAEQLYGDAKSAVGRAILVNEVPLRVVGVAPPRFQGALHDMDEPSLWMPLSARANVVRVSHRWLADSASLSLFGRLAPGASRTQATVFTRQVVTHALPDSASRVGMARSADVLGMATPGPLSNHETLQAFVAIVVIGALILLVAWTNVSSLMVAAAVGRRQEIAVRLSLGASRARLLRQLVTESTLLALTGGAAGLTLAWWFLEYKTKTEIDGVNIVPDFGTFAFVLGVAVASGILFGLSPALHATRAGMASAMRDSGKGASGRSRLQRGFVVAQIVLSQPLLVLLGTMISIVVVEYRPLAPEMSAHVISVNFRPLQHGGPAQRPEAVDSLVPRIASRAEVTGAVPDAAAFSIRGISSPDRTSAMPDSSPTVAHVNGAAPGWFALVDVPIILGRDVSLADTAAAEYPVVIGSDLAHSLFGNTNPVGRVLASPKLLAGQDSISMTVVGVYDATKRLPGMTWDGAATRTNATARIYTAHGKQWRHDRVLVRTRAPAAPFLPELHRFIAATAPALPVTAMSTLEQADQKAYLATMQEAMFAVGAGALALLLASLGLYGVVSLAVQQRTKEIGIRIAVGANPIRVARMFLASGVRVSALAMAIGLPLSVVGLRMAMSQGLVIAPGANPYVIGIGIGALLMGVAAAATWVPARRAAAVDPATTLRQD